MLGGFGARLRETRESYGLTLEEVEATTKIRKLYIEALENENFSILPPQVYAIGFVKLYAQLLNLDGEALIREFKQLAYPAAAEDFVAEKQLKERKRLDLPRLPYRNIAFAALFLLLAIWAGNIFVAYLSEKITNPPSPPPPVDNQQPVNPIKPGETENESLKLQLKVKPDMKCWIRVVVDGQNQLEATLDGEQEQTFTASDKIYIKLGNAGAVDIKINDKPITALGEIGQVAEKEFNRSDKY